MRSFFRFSVSHLACYFISISVFGCEPARVEGLSLQDAKPEVGVCEVWTGARKSLIEGSWSGELDACVSGDMQPDWRERTLELVNAYRVLAGLSRVETNPARDAMAQDCALLLDANSRLSHDPEESWACFSEEGQRAAGASNIATAPALEGIDAFIIDNGNADTLGHRRWILSNQLGPLGIGSSDEYSCLWVAGGSGDDSRSWIAWPPPGPVPYEVFEPRPSMSLDSMGWSLQSDGVCLGEAVVSITSDGESLPVDTGRLEGSYGDWCAIWIRPQGWRTQVNKSYQVRAESSSMTIEYEVNVIDCESVLDGAKDFRG